MISIKYIDASFKTFCQVSNAYIDTLHYLDDLLHIHHANLKTYINAELYDDAFNEDKRFNYIADILDELLREEK